MIVSRRTAIGAAMVASLTMATTGFAQTTDWPTRPVTLVVPFPPGASTDYVGRVMRDILAEKLGQNVIVDNRPGAGGSTGSSVVAHADPDGYTLLLTVNAPLTMNPHMQKNYPFNSMTALQPVIRVAEVVLALAVNSNVPVKTVQELIDYAKKNPEKQMSFGSAGIGSAHHLAGELLKQKTGINLVHVPYRGGAPAIQDLVAGHIPISFGTTPAVLPQAKAGTIRILALTEEKRSPDFPDIPTVAETVPGVVTYAWLGIFAPAGTPRPIIDKINKIASEGLKKPEIIAKFKSQGVTPSGGTPEGFSKEMKEEFAYWAKVFSSVGMKPQ